MTDLVLHLVAGLSRRLLEGGAMPGLQQRARRSAGLVCSFPCLSETLERVVLRGLESIPPGRLRLQKEGGIAQAAQRWGLDSPERLEAARRFDESLCREIDAASPGQTHLVVGGPGLQPAGRKIDLPPLAHPHEIHSAVLRIEAPPEAVGALRERLLRLRGVERVLHGELLQAWIEAGGPSALQPPARPGTLLALAGKGHSFQDEQASMGHPEVAPPEQAMLILFGEESPDWPAELHDYRIAPSIAHHLGVEPAADGPKPFAL